MLERLSSIAYQYVRQSKIPSPTGQLVPALVTHNQASREQGIVLGLILRHLGPVEEELHWQPFSIDFEIRKSRDNVPCKIDRILLDVR